MKNQSILKKISICTLSAIMSFSAVVPVLATDDDAETGELDPTYTYTSEDGEYTFGKISHPDKSTGTADGIVDYVGNGIVSESDEDQGDRGQSYSWAAQGYVDSNGEEWVYIR